MHKGTGHSYLAASCDDGVFKVNLPEVVFRNEAHSRGQASTTVLKGSFAPPCTPSR